MSEAKQTIGGVRLRTDRPTKVPMRDLFTWVIWQFPRPKGDGLCGAVRYPGSDLHWLPAIVCADEGYVLVYGHLGAGYETPETAVDYFSSDKEKKAR